MRTTEPPSRVGACGSVAGVASARSASAFGVGRYLQLEDAVGIGDLAAAGRALLDRVDMLHPGRHLAPGRVLAIEVRRRVEADEELAVGAVGTGGPRHRA